MLAGWVTPERAGARPALDHRQPIFNVPGVVLALLGSFLVVHLLRWALPAEDGAWLTAALAFIPAREIGRRRRICREAASPLSPRSSRISSCTAT